MAAPLLSFSIRLLLDLLGPLVVGRVRRAVEEAGGKFSSDWRRIRHVRRELRAALRADARIVRVSRSVQRFLVELLVLDWRKRNGLELVHLKDANETRLVTGDNAPAG